MFISLNVLLSFYLFSLYLETGSLHCHCCCYCWSSSHFSVCVFFSLSLSPLCCNKPLPNWWQWNYDTYQINKSVYLFDMKLRNKWQETKKKRHLSLRATNNMTIKKVNKTEKRGKKYIFFSEIVNWQYRRKVQHKIHNDSEIIEFMCWGFCLILYVFHSLFCLCVSIELSRSFFLVLCSCLSGNYYEAHAIKLWFEIISVYSLKCARVLHSTAWNVNGTNSEK